MCNILPQQSKKHRGVLPNSMYALTYMSGLNGLADSDRNIGLNIKVQAIKKPCSLSQNYKA
jgi:hypothetical protein